MTAVNAVNDKSGTETLGQEERIAMARLGDQDVVSGYVMDIICRLEERDEVLDWIAETQMSLVAEVFDDSEYRDGQGAITSTLTVVGTGCATDKIEELLLIPFRIPYSYLYLEDLETVGLTCKAAERFNNGLHWFEGLSRIPQQPPAADRSLDPLEQQRSELGTHLRTLAADYKTCSDQLVSQLERLQSLLNLEAGAGAAPYGQLKAAKDLANRLAAITKKLHKYPVHVDLDRLGTQVENGAFDIHIPF